MDKLLEPTVLIQLALLFPLIGAVLIALLGRTAEVARSMATINVVVTAVVVVLLLAQYPATGGEFANIDLNWIGPSSGMTVALSLGLDGLSVWLFGLTALLMITAVLVSWKSITDRPAGYYALLLVLQTGMLGVFVARDLVLFYIFFEFTLIPLFFLIGIWGSEQRRYAAMKFFLFTLAGSLLTFLGLLAIVLFHYSQPGVTSITFSIPELTAGLAAAKPPLVWQICIFLALFAGFAIKVPLFPLHTWLPLAHVQAPAAGSILLAGVLLKIGTYGFVRFSVSMLPEATAYLLPWMVGLAAAGIIYGALVALAQSDIKRLIAYSSVSHMGYCMLGLFIGSRLGMQGGVLQCVNHGLATGGLFAIVGMVYQRYHTREISELSGLARRAPWMAFFLIIFTLASIGLPGTNGFVGEFLILLGAFQRAWQTEPVALALLFKTVAVLAVFGVVLGAWYMLWLVQRTFFGPLREPKTSGPAPQDMAAHEVLALLPLVVMIFWIGLAPGFFLDRMKSTLDPIADVQAQAWQDHLDETTSPHPVLAEAGE